jgi:hypothetical protein
MKREEENGKISATFSFLVDDYFDHTSDDETAILLWTIVDGKTRDEKIVKDYGEWLTLVTLATSVGLVNSEMKASVYKHLKNDPYDNPTQVSAHLNKQIDDCHITIKGPDLDSMYAGKKGWTFGCGSGFIYVAQEHLPKRLYSRSLNQFQILPPTFVNTKDKGGKSGEKRHRFAVNTTTVAGKQYFFIVSFPCQHERIFDDNGKVIIEYERLLIKDEKDEKEGGKEDRKIETINDFIVINDQLVVRECHDLWLTDLHLTKKRKIQLHHPAIDEHKHFPVSMTQILPTSIYCKNLKTELSSSCCELIFPTDLVSIIFSYLVYFSN